MDDVLGEGAWLIVRRPPAAAIENVEVVDLGSTRMAPFRAHLETWLDRHRAEAVLVRPDRYVFGVGEPAVLAVAWGAAMSPLRQAA
jgi:3-(3-hydroxy-phenyl)propionate hydroxylase